MEKLSYIKKENQNCGDCFYGKINTIELPDGNVTDILCRKYPDSRTRLPHHLCGKWKSNIGTMTFEEYNNKLAYRLKEIEEKLMASFSVVRYSQLDNE